MARLNKSVVPSGMLAPSGLYDTPVNPDVQATTRPAGTLLPPSVGFDSVRVGKNRFQGKGPTGGFRRMEFAEDVGGSGSVLSVVPGETSQIDASEWLPLGGDVAAEGSIIIADRKLAPGSATGLHEGYGTIPDMGDRHPSRPLSRAWFRSLNPSNMLREEYRESPVASVLMGAGLVYVVWLLAGEVERNYRRGSGPASDVSSVPAAGARGTGEATGDVIDKIGQAGDRAVKAIEDATDKAVDTISGAAKTTTGSE